MRTEADVLVLDEPTAAMDARAEAEIFEHFRALARGRITILISHRFSTVRMADQIAVLDRGRIIERGSHEAADGRRRTLCSAVFAAGARLSLTRRRLEESRGTVATALQCAAMDEAADTFDSAFSKAVDLGNRLAGKDKEADLWDIADGLLAGAVQYWLYSRQPCGDPRCEDCVPISTAEARMAELKRLIDQLAAESEYFHAPTDANAGRA